jgi:hypothetical protein
MVASSLLPGGPWRYPTVALAKLLFVWRREIGFLLPGGGIHSGDTKTAQTMKWNHKKTTKTHLLPPAGSFTRDTYHKIVTRVVNRVRYGFRSCPHLMTHVVMVFGTYGIVSSQRHRGYGHLA